jgi:flagellar hook assembly protein FlgD
VVAADGADSIRLRQNQPNPFRANTNIAFDAKPGASLTLAVYDVQGRRVRTLLQDARSTTGVVNVAWDGTNAVGDPVPSGVYFYRLQADGEASTRKMTVAR